MAEPFFELPDCPDAIGVLVPPAIDTSPLLADCSVPEAGRRVYQCPPPAVPAPTSIATRVFHVRITGLHPDTTQDPAVYRHDWIAVEPAVDGGWFATGEAGTVDAATEGYEWTAGNAVRPGPDVYLAKKLEGMKTILFEATRTPFRLQVTASTAVATEGFCSYAYDWQRVDLNTSQAWIAPTYPPVPITDDSAPEDEEEEEEEGEEEPIPVTGTVEKEDGAVEAKCLPAVPNDGLTYEAIRSRDGQVIFRATSATPAWWFKTPAEGIDPQGWAICDLMTQPAGGNPEPVVPTMSFPVYNGSPTGSVEGDTTVRASDTQGNLVVDIEYCTEP